MADKIEMTEVQWEKAKVFWNSRPEDDPPSLIDLAREAYSDPLIELKDPKVLALRKRLTGHQMSATGKYYQKKGSIELDADQKEYIENNKSTMGSLEMAKVLFAKNNLAPASRENKAVMTYLAVIDPKAIADDDSATNVYYPPKSMERTINKVNKYRNEKLDLSKLTGKQKKDVVALMGYLSTYRFVHQINTYERTGDRDLFESTFVRCCYDKNDLTEEEVDQYIVYATEVVISSSIQFRTEKLRKLLDDASSGDSDDKKITLSLVEAINSAQTEYNQCVNRQQKLLDSLKIKRSEKEGHENEGVANLLNLFQLFREEESRRKMIKFAIMRKEKLKKGLEELDGMDEIKARICGVSKDEILYG